MRQSPTMTTTTRLGSLVKTEALPLAVAFGLLLSCGFLAGLLQTCLPLNLKSPGHAILRGILPIVMGFALVPRNNAGWWLSAGAFLGIYGGVASGFDQPGFGATTSLLLIGPSIELMRHVRSKHMLSPWIAFALAGIIANFSALIIKCIEKSITHGVGTQGGSLMMWLPKAFPSYLFFGFIAGLFAAIVFFKFRTSQEP